MSYRTIQVLLDSRGVLSVTLSRPAVRNAFNEEVISDLGAVFVGEAVQDAVRVIVLRGEGSCFCAGGDLNWMKRSSQLSYEENLEDTRKLSRLFSTINEFPKPVIAAVHGAVIGGGVGLASVADIVLATAETQFSLSEVRLGIVPACIGPFVVAKIGASHARSLFISAERFQSPKAKDIGLVHEVVADLPELQKRLDQLLSQMLECGPHAIVAAKKLVLDLSWPERRQEVSDYLEYVSQFLADLRVSPEGQEGVGAFLGKEKTELAKKMKKKILVSNRSEIACRIFQACREMGITTVGIVAPGDDQARHLTYADEVYPVTSYLDISSILDAAHKSGSGLIHPGYGFLSERPAFARAVEEAGLVFIGPRPETMELMGGKIAAKQFVSKQGVPTLPWAEVAGGKNLAEAGRAVGFPLLIKASAGGGGKGMRVVHRLEDLQELAESASSEARSSFGDGTLFLERLLTHPRHIEVQIFGNGKGEGTHLLERECSLQRRHQKIWEEAPAPHLSQNVRSGLFDSSLKLVQATQYRNAGTIEYLVDEKNGREDFYFLEMNTRLQVEHPVTELVSGVDLVTTQISQALFPDQSFLTAAPAARGHAIEVRLYAEDPWQDFIPTPGRIQKLKWPTGAGIRIESGIEEGQEVGTLFDSMLGKLIVHAENRKHALARLRFALEELVILGVGTNQNYLRSLAEHPQVEAGKVDTGFLESEFSSAVGPSLSNADLQLLSKVEKDLPGSQKNAFSVHENSYPSPWSACFSAFAGQGRV